VSGARPPAGYRRVDEAGTTIVARADLADAMLAACRTAPRETPTLHGYASRARDARLLKGRGIAYAVTLPGSTTPVVVRHNRHGGALRALTRDLFLGSTRAPRELAIALRLKTLGIPTPAVLGYGIYAAGPGLARSDVVTEEIPDSIDLGEFLLASDPGSDERRRVWGATSRLLKRLSMGGVRHHDLNVKNILVRTIRDDLTVAYALDVDRVEFDCTRRDAYAGNRARLRRSVEKWRRTRGARINDAEVSFLRPAHLGIDAAATSS
jgi:tRNA A-37 threonylcarbamoyl transferase component Bud32